MQTFIDHFGGIIPRQSSHSLNITQATIAHNVRLCNGRLEAWRERCDFSDAPNTARAFHIHGCLTYTFDTVVQIAEVSPDWGRAYITGHNLFPEIVVFGPGGTMTFSRLGVPKPSSACHCQAQADAACSRASDARDYVYTYVNRWGEESAPSPPSNIIRATDGNAVRVTGIATPPPGYEITAINLYRAVTGARPMNVQQQTPQTSYVFVDNLSASATSYVDTVLMLDLGPVLETEKTHTPPDGLQNIVSLEDTVRLGGSAGNKLYFSEPYELHNWPVKYELTLDSNIVHMGVFNQKVFVTTDTIPYVVDVSEPTGTQCVPVQRCNTPLPDIACKYPHSAISTQFGFIYSSPVGLILVKPDATWLNLTASWYDEKAWHDVLPDTVRLGVYHNYLFCITDRVSLLFNIDQQTFGDMKGSELSTLDDRPIDLVRSTTGDLFMLEKGKVSVWDKGLSYRPFYWESRELVGAGNNHARGQAWSPASAKVDSDYVKFTLISPLLNPAFERTVLGEEWFRLPRVGRNLWYKIRLEGQHPVAFAALGTANLTLNSGA